MNIIIVGCGKIGQNLADQLSVEGNNITVIDTNERKVTELSSRLDCLGIVGNGAAHEVQDEANIKNADLLVAVTGSDELNLLCCIVAGKSSDCQTIARVKNPDYYSDTDYLKDELGLAMVINPQHASAEEIARVLRFPSAMKIDTFAGGRVELVKFRLPEKSLLVGMSVRDVVAKLHCDVLICTVERESGAYIANANLTFEGKDVISLVSTPKNAEKFFTRIGYSAHSVRDVIIAGGGETATYLTALLRKDGVSVKIIEKNPAVCEALSSDFPDVTIIHGNAGDQDTLIEEGIKKTDAFIAMTTLDEENILISLFAKSVGEGKVVTKIDRPDFSGVINHLELDTIIYPKNITSDVIARYVRAMKNSRGSNVETLYNIVSGKIEAAEFIVREESDLTGKTLAELEFKDNMLIAAILRHKKVIIPRGSDKIAVGDKVIIVSGAGALHDVTDILR